MRFALKTRFSSSGSRAERLVGKSVIDGSYNHERAEVMLHEKEDHYRRIFDCMGDAVLIFDHEGRLMEANPAACAMYDYAYQEFIGMSGTEFISPEDFTNFTRRVMGGEQFHGMGSHTDKKNTPIPVTVSGSPLVFAGRPALLAVVRRASREKEALEALQNSERRLQFVLDFMPQKIFTATPEGEIDYVNPQWIAFSGMPYEVLKQGGWLQLVHPDDLERNRQVWQQTIKTGEPLQLVHRFRHTDGEYHWHTTRALPMVNAEGELAMWIGSSTDIHDVKHAEEAALQRSEQVRQPAVALENARLVEHLRVANRRKDEFLAILAHELRNPLAPMRNIVAIIKTELSENERAGEGVATLERQLGYMVRLVDDLLDVSRISRGKLELRRECIELERIVTDAMEMCRAQIDAGTHDLEVFIPPRPIYLDADPVRLVQILDNLLDNAYKYTKAGGNVWLTAESRDRDLLVTVGDTGIGIPPDKLDGIFEMFSQEEHSSERFRGGLGLGLTLVKQLVEMHGGTVTAHSRGTGQGAEFTVQLPVVVESSRAAQHSSPAGKESHAANRRILIVDDNRDNADSLATLLEMTGNETLTAYDGLEAIEAAERFRPEVLLLDIGLPKLNGLEVCRHVREQSWGKGILVVAISGWGQEEDRRKSLEAGFDHHLVKPADPSALIELLA